ncbi:Mitogen-activated protein kinase kinase 6, MPKK6 [Chondrus crispus]|uniref:mitogen-activated protein kinase kinase n=1 Tax=Chondrus crispus TaxID=2769 RepID=R7QQA8_CHOCR|nr:Mitogen-activated protein kinase kinase 6, MPKK6 [Chondrus crispus]CDF39666.1 Mitogen-activated protein kinase kinase 6, MPKK6 [Chondrus crispus]|eukprot:XP_005709960.1 Mitogen-activated protein kinase kinase 6, MPKK6 [Chondrus crispus]
MDQRRMAEVQEDQFVFGADGSFNDGGFVISSNGVVEAPERLMRKTSDGAMVEGVPTSSNNVILVKSLDEFRKSYTFRSSTEGSSTLGRGSAGRVYLAHHSRTGRKIAVKEINVYDEEKRKQLRKELQTLISHQSRFLVRSFGAFYDGAGVVHVALEFMDRGSLADIVLQRGRIPEPVVCKLMEHCLRGLAFLHENHILHRDVKTANILLSRKLCRAKLSDFGLARDLEADNTSKTDSFVGTVAYMSPERLHGRRYTYASDIWSLGITVMECVMGKFPFDTPKSYFDIVDAAQSDPAVLVQNEEISNDCVDFIRLCLHADMQERPRARDLLQHEWIRSRKDDANVLREWLDTIPRLHCEDVKVGSELAFNAMEKQRARLRAKADFL